MALNIDQGPPDRLAGHTRLLLSCRDAYMAAWQEGLVESREGSQAQADFHNSEHGPGGPWPDWLAPATRDIAVRLIRQQADFCVSVGVLIEAGQVFEPLYSMVRAGVEYGLRAFWLLEPGATLRQRCARGRLMELASVYHLRDAARHRPDREARKEDLAEFKAGWKRIKASIESMFTDVNLADDPGRWRVEGTRYESWTDVAERWLAAGGITLSGRGLYKQLAVRAHPQGYNATPGLGVGADGATTRSTSTVEISRLACITALTLYLSLRLATTYHGLDSPTVRQLETDLRSQFPSLCSLDTNASRPRPSTSPA